MRFTDKVAVVAGGGQGIGAAIAIKLAGEGAHVEVWDVDTDGGDAVVESIRSSGGTARFLRTNVLAFAEVNGGVQRVVAERGALDIMVCSVGGGRFTPFLDTDGDFFEREIRLNLTSVYNCARAAAEPMVDRNEGRMLFFSSTTGGTPGLAPYGAGKAGVESLMKSMVAEFAQSRVGVNAIMPNVTDTGLTRGSYATVQNGAEMLREVSASMPFGINTPEEVADVALYLVSDDARRITGSIVNLF